MILEPRPGCDDAVLPFFALRLGFNTGVSFGILAAEGVHGYVVLLMLALTVSTFFLGLA